MQMQGCGTRVFCRGPLRRGALCVMFVCWDSLAGVPVGTLPRRCGGLGAACMVGAAAMQVQVMASPSLDRSLRRGGVGLGPAARGCRPPAGSRGPPGRALRGTRRAAAACPCGRAYGQEQILSGRHWCCQPGRRPGLSSLSFASFHKYPCYCLLPGTCPKLPSRRCVQRRALFRYLAIYLYRLNAALIPYICAEALHL